MRKKTGSRTGGWAGNLVSVEVGHRLRVVPLWERYRVDAERINLVVDPGASFGAGDHPTTVMALELLEEAMARLKREIRAPSMLDAGTGTGILAIAAKALGSGLTVAFDIDGAAIFLAQRNEDLNAGLYEVHGERAPINFFVGDAKALCGVFDTVAANLAAPVLVRSAEVLTSLCGEYLVLSGIADEMEAAVFAAYDAVSMELIAKEHRERWNAGLLRKRTQKNRAE